VHQTSPAINQKNEKGKSLMICNDDDDNNNNNNGRWRRVKKKALPSLQHVPKFHYCLREQSSFGII
jgi:hypothetical protein